MLEYIFKVECAQFRDISNIKLLVLKNTLRCPLYITTNKKILSGLVCPQKIAKSVIAADAPLHHI
jgi:hypothetical protein